MALTQAQWSRSWAGYASLSPFCRSEYCSPPSKSLRRSSSRRIGCCSVCALLLSVGQIGVILSPGGQGLGLSSALQSESAVDDALQVLYASEMLTILALVATKAALLLALLAITPDNRHGVIIFATGVITVLWGVSNVFAIALQCPDSGQMGYHAPRGTMYGSVRAFGAITNLLLDVILIAIPSIIIIPIQTNWDKRIKILGGFWCRVVSPFLNRLRLIIQIVFLYQSPNPFSLPTTTTAGTEQVPVDFLYEIYKPTLNSLLVQTTGLRTTTMPFLKPFLMSLEFGLLRADDEARRQESTFGGSSGMNNGAAGNKMWSASKYIEIRRQRAWAVEAVKLGEGLPGRGMGFLGAGVPAVASVGVGDTTGSD
ncbi:hypothetical protein V8F33_008782 [Rhypophila sp. PSN 637]